ncbi:MAG: ABC transporter ATP-binding protein [Bradymonadia bacterium]
MRENHSGHTLRLRGVSLRHQPVGAGAPFTLSLPDLEIPPGAQWALVGASGSGKTTLLSLVGGVYRPTTGEITLGDFALSAASEGARRRHRLHTIGWIHQQLSLIPYLSVSENITLPLRLAGAVRVPAEIRQRARDLAEQVGLSHRLGHRPDQLSQGERQRVALCRALITRPALVLADEPTGNLDPTTAAQVMDLLQQQIRAHGATLLMATHDHGLLDRFDRVLDVQALEART